MRKLIIDAGAIVVKDIEEQGTYVGVPARKVKKMVKIGKVNASIKFGGSEQLEKLGILLMLGWAV